MTNSKTKYTVTDASRIAGKSRTTITAHLNAGRLAFDTDEQGKRWIDASELIRVYGDDCDFERTQSASQSSGKSQTKSEKGGQAELNSVRQLLDTERSERRREREQMQAQIDQLEASLKLAMEGHNRATLLLEDRTNGVGELERSLRKLQDQVANQEEASRKEREELKTLAKRYKRALEQEKSKPLWRKVFG